MKAEVSNPMRSSAADDDAAGVVVAADVVDAVVDNDDVVLGGDAIGVCYNIKQNTLLPEFKFGL